MREYRVVLSCGGKFHSYHAARAAWQGGVLELFITNRRRRREESPPKSLLQHHALPAYFRYGVNQIPVLRDAVPWSLWGDGLYDRLAARGLPRDFDILHVSAAYGYETGRRAKEFGAMVAVDTGAAHIVEQRDLIERACDEAGVAAPPMNPRWVDKQVVEAAEADVIFVPSNFVYRTYLEQGFPPEKLALVRYGVDTARFSPPETDAPRRGFLFVGNVSLTKGMKYLLEAAMAMKLTSETLTLVGRPASDALGCLRAATGSFTHVAQLPPDGVARLMRSSRCLVLPSVQDGAPMVVNEALACGLPVIISKNVGARDYIQDGVNGLVVPAFKHRGSR